MSIIESNVDDGAEFKLGGIGEGILENGGK
jgi:hypothetical protein